MPTKGTVRIALQIVLIFIPILNFWAFVRVNKFRKFSLLIVLPHLALIVIWGIGGYQILIFSGMSTDELGLPYPKPPLPSYMDSEITMTDLLSYSSINEVVRIIITVSYTIFSIFFIVRWTRQWNKQIQ